MRGRWAGGGFQASEAIATAIPGRTESTGRSPGGGPHFEQSRRGSPRRNEHRVPAAGLQKCGRPGTVELKDPSCESRPHAGGGVRPASLRRNTAYLIPEGSQSLVDPHASGPMGAIAAV